jgi:hypothetical protein
MIFFNIDLRTRGILLLYLQALRERTLLYLLLKNILPLLLTEHVLTLLGKKYGKITDKDIQTAISKKQFIWVKKKKQK